MIEIPLINEPYQEFTIELDGVSCDFFVNWNTISNCWSFDLRIDGSFVILGKRIVSGINLFSPIKPIELTALIATSVNEQISIIKRDSFYKGEFVLSYIEKLDLELLNES